VHRSSAIWVQVETFAQISETKHEGQTYTFYKQPLNALRALAVAGCRLFPACQNFVWRTSSGSSRGALGDDPQISQITRINIKNMEKLSGVENEQIINNLKPPGKKEVF
jgi:hypothetical protein